MITVSFRHGFFAIPISELSGAKLKKIFQTVESVKKCYFIYYFSPALYKGQGQFQLFYTNQFKRKIGNLRFDGVTESKQCGVFLFEHIFKTSYEKRCRRLSI